MNWHHIYIQLCISPILPILSYVFSRERMSLKYVYLFMLCTSFLIRSSSISFLVFDSWNDDDIKLFSTRKQGVISIHMVRLETQANPQIADMVLVLFRFILASHFSTIELRLNWKYWSYTFDYAAVRCSWCSVQRRMRPKEAMQVVM